MDSPSFKITAKGLRWFKRGHPWIFASDLVSVPKGSAAGVAEVLGPSGEFLALALYSPLSRIALRILSRKKGVIDETWWRSKLQRSLSKRKEMEIPSNARRLIYAEGDGLPSLIVDQYGDYLVVQILSAGLEIYKETIFKLLEELTGAAGILERSDVSVREKEGLPLVKRVVFGEVPQEIIIEEGDLKFLVHPWEGQKTGAFLDQRSNRVAAGERAYGTAIDLFSYDGWFACHMARKTEQVFCLESSKSAAQRLLENAKRNGLENKIAVEVGDVFDFLKSATRAGKHVDTVNLDPPGFIKSNQDRAEGFRAYKEVNLRAMKLLRPKGLLITSSCSYHFSFADFKEMLNAGARDAAVTFAETQIGHISPDHPIHPHFPEGNYLKCWFSTVVSGS